MTIKKHGLGRGLEALLANVSTKKEIHPQQILPINTLQKNNHLSPDDMNSDELTLEPVVVQKIADNNDGVGTGENSWRTNQAAGLQEVPVINKEMDHREAMAIALIETIQKENLNLVQEAEDLRKLIDEFEAMVRRL
jgi:ParB family chromosome partitioning protein